MIRYIDIRTNPEYKFDSVLGDINYNFALLSGGTSVTGAFLNLSGGTVSGNTLFSANLSATTYYSGATPLSNLFIQNGSNGLSASSTDIQLGGTLTKDTTIDSNNFDFNFYNSNNGWEIFKRTNTRYTTIGGLGSNSFANANQPTTLLLFAGQNNINSTFGAAGGIVILGSVHNITNSSSDIWLLGDYGDVDNSFIVNSFGRQNNFTNSNHITNISNSNTILNSSNLVVLGQNSTISDSNKVYLANNNNFLVLDNSGNTGFGIVSPLDRIHISDGTIRINDTGSTYGAGKLAVSDANGSISFSGISDLNPFTAITGVFLPLSGGTMFGNINMSGNGLTYVDYIGNTTLRDIDLLNSQLKYGSSIRIDWGSGWLVDNGGVISANWLTKDLKDNSNILALNWNSRRAYDESGNSSIAWDSNYALIDPATNPSLRWGTRGLIDEFNVQALYWNSTRKLLDGSANNSLLWGDRKLIYSDGSTTALDWSTSTGLTVFGNVQVYGNIDILGTASTFNTQTVQTKDNNITMNLSGSHVSALYGGITVLSGTPNNNSSTWTIDSNGAWSANTQIFTSAITVNGGVIISGGTNLYSIFKDINAISPQSGVANGTNTYTGGTFSLPTINVSALTINTLIASGSSQLGVTTASSFSGGTVSGGTIFSGGTNLYSIFAQLGGEVTSVQPGSNITTGGTATSPIINLTTSPSVNGFTASGATSLQTVSGTTFISGSTNLYSIFQPAGANTVSGAGTNTYTGGTFYNQTINVSALTINTLVASGSSQLETTTASLFSGGTVSGGTIFSGSTDLRDLFLTKAQQTGIASGNPNIVTGGTFNAPTVNLTASPSVNNLISSGSSQLGTTTASSLSGGTVSGGTIYSGGTNLYSVFHPIGAVSPITNGTNTYTGGTFLNPTVNVSALTINTLVASGSSQLGTTTASSFSGGTVSGGTLYSGGTDLRDLFLTKTQQTGVASAGPNIVTGGTFNAPTINLTASPSVNNIIASGSSQLGTTTASSFSGGTVSGGTIYSGGTNLNSIFQQNGNNSVLGDGANTYTAGTFYNQIVNVSGSPQFNIVTASGASQFTSLSAGTLSAFTIDNAFTIQSFSSSTKLSRFSNNNITAGQTRIMTLPDRSTQLLGFASQAQDSTGNVPFITAGGNGATNAEVTSSFYFNYTAPYLRIQTTSSVAAAGFQLQTRAAGAGGYFEVWGDGTNRQTNTSLVKSNSIEVNSLFDMYFTPATNLFIVPGSVSGSTASRQDKTGIRYDYLSATTLTSQNLNTFTVATSGSSVFGGNYSGTAYVDITGSTGLQTSLKIRSGSTVTNPGSGDIWNDGTYLNIGIVGLQASGGTSIFSSVTINNLLKNGSQAIGTETVNLTGTTILSSVTLSNITSGNIPVATTNGQLTNDADVNVNNFELALISSFRFLTGN